MSVPAARNQPARAFGSASSSTRSKTEEALGLVCVALAVFSLLALVSLRLDTEPPQNWVGPVGRWLGGLMASAFGWVAWCIPIDVMLLAIPLFREGRRPRTLRLAGDLVVGVLLACLLQILIPDVRVFGGAHPGGHVGVFWGELARSFLSGAGTFLLVGAALGVIAIGRSRFSFREVWSFTERGLQLGAIWVRHRFSAGLRAWQEARALRREARALEAEDGADGVEALDTLDESGPEECLKQSVSPCGDFDPPEVTGTPPLAISAYLRRQKPPGLVPVETEAPDESIGDDAAVSGDTAAAEKPRPRRRSKRRKSQRTLPDEGTETAATAEVAPGDPESDSQDAPPEGPTPSDAEKTASAAPSEPSTPQKPRIVDTRPTLQVEKATRAELRAASEPLGFKLPNTKLLAQAEQTGIELDEEKIDELAGLLVETLANHKVKCAVQEVFPGPTVTTYEVAPEPGTRVRQVAGLSDDLALGLSRKVRIIAPVPGKNRIGFELPNDERVPVNLRELVEDRRFAKLASRAPLPVVLGRDIVGKPFYADLAAMPHVIVAGATGAGKSVGLNVMLSSLLFHRSPDDLRLLMIDPKVVELAPFDGIPHMLLPVVTDMNQAVKALKWAVDEMERRYQLFARAGTKNIKTYNNWVQRVLAGEIPAPRSSTVTAIGPSGEDVEMPAATEGSDGVELPEKLPAIVIVVDEFADLMMQQGKDVEAAVARLAQKARAAGMHVVLATQRPSVDVITGMIKANFPTRVAFRVAQRVDSRTILDEQGAELLLGAGDMLVKLNGSSETRRVQCPFISEEEVQELTDHLRKQGVPEYNEDILKGDDDDKGYGSDDDLDTRFDEAVQIVADTRRCSTSWLQRKMTIGYNRAAKIVEAMEVRGMVGPPNGSKEREIFVNTQ